MLPFAESAPEFDADELVILVLEEWEALSTAVDMEVVMSDAELRKAREAATKLSQFLEGYSVSLDEVDEAVKTLQDAMTKLRRKEGGEV